MSKCKICFSTTYRKIGKPRVYKEFPKVELHEYEIVQCENCDFYYLNPNIKLSQNEWTVLYEDNYFEAANETDWQKNLHNKERKNRLEIIANQVDNVNTTFLDLGCGEGKMLTLAAEFGFNPVGVDIAYNLSKEVDKKKIDFIKGDIFSANFDNNYISALYMDSVLEHVEQPLEVLKELNRIMRPEGIGLIIVPNEDSLINSFKMLLYKIALKGEKFGRIRPFVPPYHINGFNEKSLSSAISNAGFEIIDLSMFGGGYKFWKAHKPFSKGYFRELMLYPISLLSLIFGQQYQLQILFTKKDNKS